MNMYPSNLGQYYGPAMQGSGNAPNLQADPRVFMQQGVSQHHMMYAANMGVPMGVPNVPPPPYTPQHAEAFQQCQRNEEVRRAKLVEEEQKRRQLEATRQRLRQVGGRGTGVTVDSLIRNIVGPTTHRPTPSKPAPQPAASAPSEPLFDAFSDFQAAHNPSRPPPPAAPPVRPQAPKPDLNSFMLACSDLSVPSKAKTFAKATPTLAQPRPAASSAPHAPVAVQSKKATQWGVVSSMFDGVFVHETPHSTFEPSLHQPTLNPPSQQVCQPPQEFNHQPDSGHAQAETGTPTALPAWTSQHETLPLVYQQLHQAAVREEGRLDTGFLYNVFLTSGLSVEVLGHIWGAVNRTRPGELLREELNAALALIAVMQQRPDAMPSLALVDPLPAGKPPEPTFFIQANGAAQPAAQPAAPLQEEGKSPAMGQENHIGTTETVPTVANLPTPVSSVPVSTTAPREDFGSFQTASRTENGGTVSTVTNASVAAGDKYSVFRQLETKDEEWSAFSDPAPASSPAAVEVAAHITTPAADSWATFPPTSPPTAAPALSNGCAAQHDAWANFSSAFASQLEVIDLTVPARPRQASKSSASDSTPRLGVKIAADIELPPSEEKHDYVDAFAREDFGTILSSSSASTSEDYADLSSQASYEPTTSTSTPSSVESASPRHQPLPAKSAFPAPARPPPVALSGKSFDRRPEMGSHAWQDEPPPLDCVEEDEFGDFQSSTVHAGVVDDLPPVRPADPPPPAQPAVSLPSLVSMPAPSALSLPSFLSSDTGSLGGASSVKSLELHAGLAVGEEGSTASVKSLDLHPPPLTDAVSVRSLEEEEATPTPVAPASLMTKAPSMLLPTNDRYCSIGGELMDSVDLQVCQWQRCLAAARDRLDASCSLLARAESAEVLTEVLSSQRTETHLEAVVEIYLVTRRIAAAVEVFSFVKKKLEGDLLHLDELWSRLCNFLQGATVHLPSTDLGHFKLLVSGRAGQKDVDLPSCGVCLGEFDVQIEAQRSLEFGGREYHCGCANFWVNCVDATLPSFTPPRLL